MADNRSAHQTVDERAPESGVANDDYTADLELVERFAYDWEANAANYKQMLGELRNAAQRLLPVCRNIDRARKMEEEIVCLARQPLFFPEMFHGATLLPDGTVGALNRDVALHLRRSGLLGHDDRIAITEMYKRLLQTSTSPLRVVEIGSAIGRGSTPIAGEFVKRSGGTLYCIDPWEDSMYFGFLSNVRIFDLEDTVVPIRSFSAEAAALFDDESLDAVFVDGSHIYPYVLADIDAYLPKIRKDGIMFGHDLHDLPSRFDRRELLSVAKVNNTLVNYTAPGGEVQRVDAHPGVILAVQDRFGDDVDIFPGSVVWAVWASGRKGPVWAADTVRPENDWRAVWETDLRAAQKELAATRDALAEQKHLLSEARRSIAEREQELDNRGQELSEARCEIAEIERSLSWRVTAPLRGLTRKSPGLRNLLRR